ncbi:MAG: hypothetical protein L6R39_006038 [Caloplaca ligustica]|nr:MAG: hypothetical protein L6R39_006038 [Caloplaca ligustica]
MPDQEIRLLALDGGGVRGLSSLLILQQLMETIDPDSPPKPCDYFDMIGGTSTGGLIAIMLGRLKLSIDECIESYLSISEQVFQKKRHRVTTKGNIQGRFDSTELERAIKQVVTKQGLDEDALLKETSGGTCKVFVCATSKQTSATVCLTSYKSPRGSSDLLNSVTIWEACRATSAASSFFDPIAIGRYGEEFVDGATGANNPVWQVWDQAQLIWGPESIEGKIKCLVSIGTGIPSLKPFKDDVFSIGTTLLAIAKETERTAETFRRDKTCLDNTSRYYRFNVTRGLEDVGLEESKKKKEIAAVTRAYVTSQDVFKQMQACCASDVAGRKSEETRCLQSFWPTGIDYVTQMNQNPKRVPETCLWTLENQKYTDWRDDSTKKLLWISADPGCGKSVLARCIVEEDLQQAFRNNPSKHVLQYFFKDTSPEQRSATRAISALLHQLFSSQPRLIRHALPSYRRIGKALSATFPSLWSIFTAASTDPIAGDVFCVLDALDECNEQEQQMLTNALENFYLDQPGLSSTSRLKILITSRPYFEIRRNFDGLLDASANIELAGKDESASIQKEIDLVIKHRVAKLAQENRLQKTVADHLERRLLQTEHRTYLWLHLLWEIIRKSLSGTITEMNQLIDKLPAGIQEAYEALLQRCPEPSFARKVFQIVLVAYQPLTLDEMDVALKVSEHTSSYADLELEGSSRLQDILPTRCGLMISVVHSKVYFIHQTVKEFLLNVNGVKPPAGRIWQQSLGLEESHDVLAEVCLRCLEFSEIRLDLLNLGNALVPEYKRFVAPGGYCKSYDLLSYTAIYWADHCRSIRKCEYMPIISRLLESSSCRSIIDRNRFDYGTVLHGASLGGHAKIAQLLLDKGADVNAQAGRFSTALQAASSEGHYKVVQILIQKGANINIQGGKYDTALQAASSKGYEIVVQMLLEKGADINAQGGVFSNALQAASSKGHETVVQILLEKGADVNAQGGPYSNALQAAAAGGYRNVVQILIEKGADINAQGGSYGNALQAAAVRGYRNVVQILIEKGADVNAQGGFYGNALQAAAAVRGYRNVVQILIEKGADVNAQGGYYGNALQAALYSGHWNVARMLVENGADIAEIFARGGRYRDELQAMLSGDDEVSDSDMASLSSSTEVDLSD